MLAQLDHAQARAAAQQRLSREPSPAKHKSPAQPAARWEPVIAWHAAICVARTREFGIWRAMHNGRSGAELLPTSAALSGLVRCGDFAAASRWRHVSNAPAEALLILPVARLSTSRRGLHFASCGPAVYTLQQGLDIDDTAGMLHQSLCGSLQSSMLECWLHSLHPKSRARLDFPTWMMQHLGTLTGESC